MRERVLTPRELDRALLARQLLLRRSRAPLVPAVEQLGGLQAQYAPQAYIALAGRLERFALGDLTRRLERRTLVQATLLRGTIHVVTPRDFALFAAGVRASARAWWQRLHRDVPADEVRGTPAIVRERLAGHVMHRDELLALVEERHPGRGRQVWNGLAGWVNLVRVPPSGTWERRRADLYAVAEDWLGGAAAAEDDGLAHLLRRYLAGFGPATLNDAAGWAGVPVTALRPAVERIRLRRVRGEGGAVLLDVPRAPLPPGDTPAPPRFLPTWDATLLVHARRTGILPEEYRPLVFDTKTPHSAATFTVDGRVAGAWRLETRRGRATVLLTAFDGIPRAARAALRDEATRLAHILEPSAASVSVEVR